MRLEYVPAMTPMIIPMLLSAPFDASPFVNAAAELVMMILAEGGGERGDDGGGDGDGGKWTNPAIVMVGLVSTLVVK